MEDFIHGLVPYANHFFGCKVKAEANGCGGRIFTSKKFEGLSFYSENNSSDNVQRVRITGYYPHQDGRNSQEVMHAGDNAPSITVSAQRLPEDIWKDIERKFISPYQELFDIVLSRVEERNDYDKLKGIRRRAAMQFFKENGYEVQAPTHTDKLHFNLPSKLARSVYGDVQIHVASTHSAEYLDTYTLEMHNLTANQFAAVMKSIGTKK